MRAPTLLMVILTTSCSAYRFVKTDPGFTALEKKEVPLVCLHETPPSFRSVGVIELDCPQDISPDDLRAKAADAGKKLGCDVVVSTELTAANLLLSRGIVLVHGEGHEAPAAPPTQSDSGSRGVSREVVPRKTFRFNCGVLMSAGGA